MENPTVPVMENPDAKLDAILAEVRALREDRDRLLTVEELAEILQLHPKTVYGVVGKEISGIKIGGAWRFDLKQVRRDLEKRSIGGYGFDIRRSATAKKAVRAAKKAKEISK